MPRPRKHSDGELLAAAARSIARHGPHDLTLAHVASEAGVAPATLVQRFGSKRGLLLAVAGAAPTGISESFARARARSRSALAGLETALVELASSVTDPDEIANHLAFLALDLSDREFREHAARDTHAMRSAIEDMLREAVADGELAIRTRPALADLIQAAYHGALLMWAIERQGQPEDHVRRHVRLALKPYRRAAT